MSTRNYNFRCPALMELRKQASFVDDPKDFRDRFRRLLFFLSTDVENGLLCTLVQFYDPVYRCFTFPDYQLFPTMEEYAYLLSMPVSHRVHLISFLRTSFRASVIMMISVLSPT